MGIRNILLRSSINVRLVPHFFLPQFLPLEKEAQTFVLFFLSPPHPPLLSFRKRDFNSPKIKEIRASLGLLEH